jgi:microcystin-dependent protein
MPRSGSGTYTLPAGSLVTDGVDDILASQHNTPLQDLAVDANTARPVVAGGTGATTAAGALVNLGIDGNLVPSGAVMHFAMNTAPTGWLKANGAAVSRTTYAALFAAIGTTYGAGNGSTTFNLPDLRGEFLRGWDDGRGVDSGRGFGTAQGDDFKAHSHTTIGFYTAGTTVSPGENWSSSDPTQNKSSRRTEDEGGTETRPRNIALLACIKF